MDQPVMIGRNRCVPPHIWDAVVSLMEPTMTRDDDYVLELLREAETSPDYFHAWPSGISQDLRKTFHLLVMERAGLIALSDIGGGTYWLTNEGQNILAASREPEGWRAVKSAGAKAGSAGLTIMAKIAEAFIMQKARELGVIL